MFNKNLLKNKIFILDGAMGTNIQLLKLQENDFYGDCFINHSVSLKGNNEILSITRPDLIRNIHKSFLKAGADIIKTNTFNANRLSQRIYSIDCIRELNRVSIQIARNAVNEFSTSDKPRFIAGSIGPTCKTASISPNVNDSSYRDVTFDDLVSVYTEQIEVMFEEDVDILLLETIFDTLNAKAAIYVIKNLQKKFNKDIPVMISVTLSDKSGRTLSGQRLDAFYYSIEHINPLSVGINCALGIKDIKPYLIELSDMVSCGLSVHANAGIPNIFGTYTDSPEYMAKEYRNLAENGCINICGGCCGTTPEHIKAIYEAVKNVPPREIKNRSKRSFTGLETLTTDSFIMVGERTNVTGSAKFARLIVEDKINDAVEVAVNQIENGANIIDINMDKDLIDSKNKMIKFLNVISTEPDIAKVPFMIDSSDFEVIKAGLKCIQGKGIVNSISLKEGEEKFIERAREINDLGAAMIVMAFDEKGQAATTERRVEITDRAYKILKEKVGIPDENIIFDINIFPVATGMKEHNINAISFIEATKIIKSKYPNVSISGGVSNLSFSFRGLNKIRNALHSVFLYHAINAGMSMGIVNAGMIDFYDDIEEPLKSFCENVILNKTDDAGDRLLKFAESFVDQERDVIQTEKWRNKSVEDRLQYALIRGNSKYLKDDIRDALMHYKPLDLIEGPLMESMNKIGKLFDEGKMFLPQIIKSARVMKQCIDCIQDYLPKTRQQKKIGKIVLATVNGDVHDIGKNILSLILECNNFEVIDLGVAVSCKNILETAVKENADLIGLSGLITPSLDEMIIVAEQMEREGLNLPGLLIGGATTSALHTALKIAPKYHGLVVQTSNASEAVVVAQRIMNGDSCFIDTIRKKQKKLVEEFINK